MSLVEREHHNEWIPISVLILVESRLAHVRHVVPCCEVAGWLEAWALHLIHILVIIQGFEAHRRISQAIKGLVVDGAGWHRCRLRLGVASPFETESSFIGT
jgi:hypothetical protein